EAKAKMLKQTEQTRLQTLRKQYPGWAGLKDAELINNVIAAHGLSTKKGPGQFDYDDPKTMAFLGRSVDRRGNINADMSRRGVASPNVGHWETRPCFFLFEIFGCGHSPNWPAPRVWVPPQQRYNPRYDARYDNYGQWGSPFGRNVERCKSGNGGYCM